MVSACIGDAIEPEILMGETRRAARKPTTINNLSALDCCGHDPLSDFILNTKKDNALALLSRLRAA
jgi:hypothetical protein